MITTDANYFREHPERDQMSELGRELMESAGDYLGHLDGADVGARTYRVVDVRSLRRRLGLTQQAFASRYGFTLKTVRNWEQGRRTPRGPARTLLKVLAHNPRAVEEALEAPEEPAPASWERGLPGTVPSDNAGSR